MNKNKEDIRNSFIIDKDKIIYFKERINHMQHILSKMRQAIEEYQFDAIITCNAIIVDEWQTILKKKKILKI